MSSRMRQCICHTRTLTRRRRSTRGALPRHGPPRYASRAAGRAPRRSPRQTLPRARSRDLRATFAVCAVRPTWGTRTRLRTGRGSARGRPSCAADSACPTPPRPPRPQAIGASVCRNWCAPPPPLAAHRTPLSVTVQRTVRLNHTACACAAGCATSMASRRMRLTSTATRRPCRTTRARRARRASPLPSPPASSGPAHAVPSSPHSRRLTRAPLRLLPCPLASCADHAPPLVERPRRA